MTGSCKLHLVLLFLEVSFVWALENSMRLYTVFGATSKIETQFDQIFRKNNTQ